MIASQLRFITRPLVIVIVIAAAVMIFACQPPDNQFAGDDASARARAGDAGSSDSDENAVVARNGLPCDVNEVLAKNCQTCHAATPKSGASTALMTWDDLQKEQGSKKLYQLVKDRILAEAGRMPPAARLADAEIKAIDNWVTSGAKKFDGECTTNAPPAATQPFVCNAPNERVELKSKKPFTWTPDIKEPDHYMCFGMDRTVTGGKRHIISLGPNVQNFDIVHHILLFQSKDPISQEPFPCGTTETGKWKLVTGWAPGGKNFDLPPQAGYPEEGTVHWVMQVHYNNSSGKFVGATDTTGYQLCTTNQLRPNDAGTLAFGSHQFEIPPRIARWTQRCDYKLGDKYKGVKFFAGTPHMHKLGLAIRTERLPGGTGAPDLVYEQNPFSFENQEATIIDKSVEPGDIMRTRCTFKNPGDTTVKWGEGTGDEMCFNFLYYYPAIPDFTIGPLPVQTWVSPSLNDIFPMLVRCSVE